MGLIETYNISEGGFHPFLIQDCWQVSKLNYDETYHINNLTQCIKHRNSDRAISLLCGTGILIVDINNGNTMAFTITLMKHGTSYDIPKNTNYVIVMKEGCELFSVENPNMHTDDIIECNLNEEQLRKLRKNVNEEFKK